MRDAKEIVRLCRFTYSMQGAEEVVKRDRICAKLAALSEFSGRAARSAPEELPGVMVKLMLELANEAADLGAEPRS